MRNPSLAALALAALPAAFGQQSPPAQFKSRTDAPPPGIVLREIVTGEAQSLVQPADRAAAIALLEGARQNFALLRNDAPPYHLVVNIAAGSQSGTMTEDWNVGNNWTWTADFAGVSVDRAGGRGGVVSTDPAAPVPLRVAMARNLFLHPVGTVVFDNDSLRLLPIDRGGAAWQCLLVNPALLGPTPPMGRAPRESEFCFDAASRLVLASNAPGEYATYDYTGGRSLQGHNLPAHVIVADDGKITAAYTLADFSLNPGPPRGPRIPAANEKPAFEIGTPSLMWTSEGMPDLGSDAATDAEPPAETIVVLRASVSPAGKLGDVDVVSGVDDPALLAEAMRIAQGRNLGITPAQRQMYFVLDFVPGKALIRFPTSVAPLDNSTYPPGRAPFVAVFVTHTVQTLADGNVITRENRSRQARAADGSTLDEQIFTPPAGQPAPQPSYMLFNAQTGERWQIMPAQQRAMRMGIQRPLPPPAIAGNGRGRGALPPGPRLPPGTESLGSDQVAGVEANGTRHTQIIPAGQAGNRDPITVVTETWINPDTGLVVRNVTNDPRTGVSTREAESLLIGNPPPDLFTLPAGYKLTDGQGNPLGGN